MCITMNNEGTFSHLANFGMKTCSAYRFRELVLVSGIVSRGLKLGVAEKLEIDTTNFPCIKSKIVVIF